jgi:hypothetical protein
VGAGCTAIAALSLRSPSNSKILYDAGAPEVILQGMKIHVKDSSVQVCYVLHCFIRVLLILPYYCY